MTNGSWYHAKYTGFYIESESNKFMLHFDGKSYQGDAGDSLASRVGKHSANNRPFTTTDMDNDHHPANCADKSGGGWWYRMCSATKLTGRVGPDYCWTWDLGEGPLNASYMMIRRETPLN